MLDSIVIRFCWDGFSDVRSRSRRKLITRWKNSHSVISAYFLGAGLGIVDSKLLQFARQENGREQVREPLDLTTSRRYLNGVSEGQTA